MEENLGIKIKKQRRRIRMDSDDDEAQAPGTGDGGRLEGNDDLPDIQVCITFLCAVPANGFYLLVKSSKYIITVTKFVNRVVLRPVKVENPQRNQT